MVQMFRIYTFVFAILLLYAIILHNPFLFKMAGYVWWIGDQTGLNVVMRARQEAYIESKRTDTNASSQNGDN